MDFPFFFFLHGCLLGLTACFADGGARICRALVFSEVRPGSRFWLFHWSSLAWRCQLMHPCQPLDPSGPPGIETSHPRRESHLFYHDVHQNAIWFVLQWTLLPATTYSLRSPAVLAMGPKCLQSHAEPEERSLSASSIVVLLR